MTAVGPPPCAMTNVADMVQVSGVIVVTIALPGKLRNRKLNRLKNTFYTTTTGFFFDTRL
jgi:hypothetical protein